MANQKNTPGEWILLAEGDLSVAEHLAVTMSPTPTAAIVFHCNAKVTVTLALPRVRVVRG